METDDFDAKTEAFLQWLTAAGITLDPKVSLVDYRSAGRGRGVVALADIAEDEVLFTIPRSAVLNTSTALSHTDSDVAKAILQLPPWLALTATILAEGSQEHSKWAPYLALLPQHLDSLAFWSAPELAELQASAVVHKIGKETAEQMFSEHLSPLGLSNDNSETCHRIASIIMAYAFDIPEKTFPVEPEPEQGGNDEDDLVSDDEGDEKTILSMIPLADMLNADADRNNARLCCDNDDLEMRSIKPILKGEEIFNDYGQLPRSDLLRRYGYVTDNYASYDVAELSTKSLLALLSLDGNVLDGNTNLLPLSKEELERRVELAQREGIYEDSYDLLQPGPDGPGIRDELVALCYLLLLDNENFAAIETSEVQLPGRSKLTTSLVGKLLVKVLGLRSVEYATPLVKDQAILLAGKLSHRKTMAVQVRLGEKLVLQRAIREATSFEASDKRLRITEGTRSDNSVQFGSAKRKGTDNDPAKKRGRFR